jgi:inorganic pyrophosphatase
MPNTTLLQESAKFEIEAYKPPKDHQRLKLTHVAFTGSPRRHPYDADKVILIADPYSTNTFYYEFNAEDISYGEEMPSIVSSDGEAVTMVRIWVKKKSIGIRSMPFVVDEIRQ